MASDPQCRDVLITGATGYIGRPLAEQLVRRGHRVRSLARWASLRRAVAGTAIEGDALDANSIAAALVPGATLVAAVEGPAAAGTRRIVGFQAIRESTRR